MVRKQYSEDIPFDGELEGFTIVIVYSCLREFIVRSRMTTMPPPSTVSMVLARRLGVRASKSFGKEMTTISMLQVDELEQDNTPVSHVNVGPT